MYLILNSFNKIVTIIVKHWVPKTRIIQWAIFNSDYQPHHHIIKFSKEKIKILYWDLEPYKRSFSLSLFEIKKCLIINDFIYKIFSFLRLKVELWYIVVEEFWKLSPKL